MDMSEDLQIKVTDIQRIDHVPTQVQELIRECIKGRRLNKSGLPSVQYLGAERVNVVGAFQYGDIAFLEIEGKWSNIIKENSFLAITAYRPDKSYEELVEGRQEYIEELKEKYPEGVTVE